MRLASFAAMAMALCGFVFVGTINSANAMSATGLAGGLGKEVQRSAEFDNLVRKTHGTHRRCRWSRRRGWHRHTGRRNRTRRCLPHTYYDYGYYYGPYFYWGPRRRTYRGYRRRGPRVVRPRRGRRGAGGRRGRGRR